MKKILVVLGVCSIILACNSAEKSESTEEAVVEQAALDTSTTANAGPSKGEQLISSSDCLTCHKVDTKIVGPSYVDVANKYEASEANIEMLAGKIINGGLGVWGEIPMAPHTALSTDDAKEMVKYILSLKTN